MRLKQYKITQTHGTLILFTRRTMNNEHRSVLWDQHIRAVAVSLSTAFNVLASQAHSFQSIFPFILFSYVTEHFGVYSRILEIIR